MEIAPTDAKEALAVIQDTIRKTRHAISKSGVYLFLILWGCIWLLGFSVAQFWTGMAGVAWTCLDLGGGIASVLIGVRMSRVLRTPYSPISGKHLLAFCALLILFCAAVIAASWPVDAKRLALYIILFVMLGWTAAALLLAYAAVLPGLGIAGLALVGYFLLPNIFFLWMAVLGGGGMVGLGIFMRLRW